MAEEAPDKPRVRVLFLCVHNAARSQMAEALLRRLAPESCDVESAGFEPRAVLPEAVRAMSLIGIDMSGARSKAVFDLYRAGRIEAWPAASQVTGLLPRLGTSHQDQRKG